MKMRAMNAAKRLGSTAIMLMAALALATAGCGSDDGGEGGNGGGGGGSDVTGGGDTTGADGGTTGDTGGGTDNDTGGTTGGDTGGGGNTDGGTTDPDTGGTGTQENCINGKDDDGDGKIDCEDSDCSTSPACVEDCDDEKDNDGDGDVDCEDSDCAAAAVCDDSPETCNNMYVCLIEVGCDCTLGVDCPEGAGTGPCLQTCYGDQDCYNGCLGELTLDTQTAWGNWQQCLSANCAQVSGDAFESCYVGQCLNEYAGCFFGCGDTTPPSKDPKANKQALVDCTTAECQGLSQEEDLSSCYFDACLPEATQCLYNGDATCAEGFFGCYVDCPTGDQDCQRDCIRSLSSQGAYDLFNWDGCRFGLCDADDDGKADSTDCLVASFLACSDVMGSCGVDWTGAEGCNTTTDCIIGCGGFGNNASTCIDGCLTNMSAAALATVSDVFACAIGACGTTADAITTACVEASLANECAAEATACGYTVAPVENCTDKIDNDGDSAIDCADSDCADHATCKVVAEICDNTTDDDGDGAIDCADTDCAAFPACIPDEICDNGKDDDGDEKTDCDDEDCVDAPACK